MVLYQTTLADSNFGVGREKDNIYPSQEKPSDIQ